MKRNLILSAASLAAMMMFAQDEMLIHFPTTVETIKIEDIDKIKFVDGVMKVSTVSKMSGPADEKQYDVPEISYADFTLDDSKSDTVFVTFDGSKVSINDYSWNKITYNSDGANVSFTSEQDQKNIVYYLSGTSTDGSFTITPDRAFTIVMDNLSLSSASSSPIVINLGADGDSYATNIELKGKSTLSDGSASSYKGCIYAKSKLKFGELGGDGELTISGNTKHAINSSKKTEIYAGSVNIISSASDGLNSDGLQMYGGKLDISGTAGDGVDVSEAILINDGEFTFTSAANDAKALKCDSSIVVNGGKVNITMTGAAAKGFKTSYADVVIAGGEVTMSVDGAPIIADGDTSYSAAIKTDMNVRISGGKVDLTLGTNATASKGITADGNVTIDGGYVKIANNGGYYSGTATVTTTTTGNQGGPGRPGQSNSQTTTSTVTTYIEGRCIKGNNVYLTSGEIILTTSNGAKGVKADAELVIGAEKADNSLLSINVTTSGTATSSSSSSSNNGFGGGGFGGGMSDGNSESYAGNPKAFVAETITVNSGTIVINAKDDAFHANSKMIVNGGKLTVDTSDDAFHSDGDLTINNGWIRVNTAYEGLEGANIYINDGYIHITTTDDCLNVTTDNTGMLRITGGQIWACASSGDHDCLDSNGSIEITGGLVIACGSSPLDAGDGGSCYQKHTGGTVLVLGPSSAGMWSQDVNITCANSITNTSCSIAQGATLCVANSSGNVIAACKVPVAISKVIFAYGSSLSGYSFYTTTSNVDFDLFENQYKENTTITSGLSQLSSSGSSWGW